MKFLPVLLVLLLIPLSRALFYLVVWIFHKKENTENKNGIEIANRMLVRTGLRSKVNVLLAGDKDCYDPISNTVYLTEKNNKNTISSLAISIHEVGHALQMNERWGLYLFRCKIIPFKEFLIFFTAFSVMWGMVYENLIFVPIISLICLLVCVVVELIVEINASVRGCRVYKDNFTIDSNEMKAVGVVLGVAAFTYFADIINCLYLIVKILMIAAEKNEKKTVDK